MQLALEVNQLTKSFGHKIIYHSASFLFEKGCYAIVGPNGAGKSVLLDILAGVSHQDSGSVNLSAIGDNHSFQYKQQLTYIPSKPMFFPAVTGSNFLSFILSIKNKNNNLSNLENLVEAFKLESHLSSRFDEMSLGTQKKMFLSTLAVGSSALIVLDEPTNALDDQSCQALYKKINQLSDISIVILATHDEDLLGALNPTIIRLTKPPTNQFTIYGASNA